MTRTNKLLPASWKGIPFFVRSEILSEGGRRIVLHDYPNSSERFVEDLGSLPPKFSITAFVTGEDFIDRAEQLERALNEPGKGRLSIPTFGRRSLFALPYKKDANQTEVGEIKFNLEFVAGKSISTPIQAPNTVHTVYSLGDTARGATSNALEKSWVVPSDTPNVLTAQFDLEQFTKAIGSLLTSVDNQGDVTDISNSINTNSPSIVRSGSELSDYFINQLWQTISVGLKDGNGLPNLQDLTGFGGELSLSLSDIKNASIPATSMQPDTEIPLWPETTAGRIERNQNRLSLINAGRIAALVSAYEQAADTTYQTEQEIEETRLSLETEHQRLMRVDTEDKSLIQSQESVRSAVENIRLAMLSVLDQKEQSAYSLTNINSNVEISSFVLAYDLYAEDFTTSEQLTQKGIDIRLLNIDQPADKLYKEIKVLQS